MICPKTASILGVDWAALQSYTVANLGLFTPFSAIRWPQLTARNGPGYSHIYIVVAMVFVLYYILLDYVGLGSPREQKLLRTGLPCPVLR